MDEDVGKSLRYRILMNIFSINENLASAPLRYLMCAVALQSPLDPPSESSCETILDSLLTSDEQLWKGKIAITRSSLLDL